MKQKISILITVAVLMLLVSGMGVYLASRSAINQANEDADLAFAQGFSQTLSQRIAVTNLILNKIAQDPELITAFANSDKAALEVMAAKYEQFIPGSRKIRLLPVGVVELDQTSTPRMGYGDLDMVKATFQDNPLPTIQGDIGPDRHLAITQRVSQGNQAVGVILASLNFDFISDNLNGTTTPGDYIELRQEKLPLASLGTKPESEDNIREINVPGTNWNVYFQSGNNGLTGNTLLLIGLVVMPMFVVFIAGLMCLRQLLSLLDKDQDLLLQAFKDVLTDKPQGSYPVRVEGMSTVIAALVRYNREYERYGASAITNSDDFELEGYFDEALPESPSTTKPAKTVSPVEAKQEIKKEIASSKPDSTTEKPKTPAITEQPKLPEASASIFRAYDIRGIVGKTLTKEIVFDVGRAFGSEAKEQGCNTVVVAMDGRLSSPTLLESLIKGLTSTGCSVLNIGMVPTPVLYFVVQHTEGRTGIMVTGSHNPADYNGLKLVLKGETLAGPKIQLLKQRIETAIYLTGAGSVVDNGMFVSEYIGTITEDIQVMRPLKIIIDCGNGVAGEIAPILFKSLGCEVIELFCEVDGNFPNHHPDPSDPKNLAELIKQVKQQNADVGIAFDGDADRLGVIDSNGKVIWPDRQMMLFAKDVLAGKPGSEIIYDVKCSRHLPVQIVKFGGRPLIWKTGHSYMKAKLKETGAKLAGEMSGHIFFNDRWFGFDDALYSTARLLQILSEDSRSSADVFADFPDSFCTPELNIAMAEGESAKFIEKLILSAKSLGGKMTDIDGVRIDFADSWGLVRASNTTPSLVIRFEGDTQEAMSSVQEKFRKLMQHIKPDLKLPF